MAFDKFDKDDCLCLSNFAKLINEFGSSVINKND